MSSDKLWGLGVDHKVTNSGEVRINCPFCPTLGFGQDTKFHMYVNPVKRVFNCYKCNSRGSINKLKNFISFSSTTVQANFSELRSKLAGLFVAKPTTEFDLDLISWSIFDEKCPLGYKYMRDRGFSDDEMVKYNLRVGKNYVDDKTGKVIRRWSGRILFPFIEGGQVVFVVGRSYNNKEPKYINSFGSKDHVVFGIDRIKNNECILCEGIVSAIAAERETGIPAISCLGKTATKWQLSKIRSKTNKVYVSLDGTEDVTDKDRRTVNRSLMKLGIKVFEIRLPDGKDPDDLKDEFKMHFDNAKEIVI